MHKNKFLTFLFSLIPGAGQMYLGFMRRGVSLMLLFTLVIAVAAGFYMGFLCILLPVIWFYAFFDAMNLSSLPFDQQRLIQDEFLFGLDSPASGKWKNLLQKRHVFVGVLFILGGAYLLFENLVRPLLWQFFENSVFRGIFRSIPTIVVAVAIICLGVYLVKGDARKRLDSKEDDYVEYNGGSNDKP